MSGTKVRLFVYFPSITSYLAPPPPPPAVTQWGGGLNLRTTAVVARNTHHTGTFSFDNCFKIQLQFVLDFDGNLEIVNDNKSMNGTLTYRPVQTVQYTVHRHFMTSENNIWFLYVTKEGGVISSGGSNNNNNVQEQAYVCSGSTFSRHSVG